MRKRGAGNSGSAVGRRVHDAADLLRTPLNALIDFLVEDACVVCRRPTAGSSAPWIMGPARHLVEPLRVRGLLGAMAVVNHPVCVRCAASLVEASSTGLLPTPANAPDVRGTELVTGGEAPQAAEPTPTGLERERQPVVVVAPFMTTDGVLEIVHQLKFKGYKDLALPIGRCMVEALGRLAPGVCGADLVVPTPMDPRSERRRGFNQAERIARVLAADLGVSLATEILRKTSRTPRQSQTPRERRAANVEGAFACAPGSGHVLAGRSVVLVDDLVTSGATASVCAAALLGTGAGSVTVACFGRAL